MNTSGGMEYFRLSRPVGRLGYERTEEGDVIRFMQFDDAANHEIQRIIDDADDIEVTARYSGSDGDPYLKVRPSDEAWFDRFLRLLADYGFAVQHGES
jgi:hypothetical protein